MMDTTVSGATCERWDAGLAHYETFALSNLAEKPINSLSELGNKCRNYKSGAVPKRSAPWCYTSTSWELCNPPFCGESLF